VMELLDASMQASRGAYEASLHAKKLTIKADQLRQSNPTLASRTVHEAQLAAARSSRLAETAKESTALAARQMSVQAYHLANDAVNAAERNYFVETRGVREVTRRRESTQVLREIRRLP